MPGKEQKERISSIKERSLEEEHLFAPSSSSDTKPTFQRLLPTINGKCSSIQLRTAANPMLPFSHARMEYSEIKEE